MKPYAHELSRFRGIRGTVEVTMDANFEAKVNKAAKEIDDARVRLHAAQAEIATATIKRDEERKRFEAAIEDLRKLALSGPAKATVGA